MRVLVVNAGSSSLKLSVLEEDEVLTSTTVERWDGADDLEPLRHFLGRAPDLDAVGHRVVHGGPRHRASARIDDDLLVYLESIADLAPLHNPRAVAAIRAVAGLLPRTPAVAAFDTSFHATIPNEAATYALPREWNHRYGLRRYGFHGLSHASASRRAAALVGRDLRELRMVTCHLGAGASLCAVVDGRSVDTTMGFTPLAGLVMQTRVGSVDPGLVLWLLDHANVDSTTLGQVLEHQSGLKGLSGTSGDLRDVLAAREGGDGDARAAFDVYVHRLVREVGAMTASAGGLDVLVFTGGMGEHSPVLRSAACRGLAHLGVAVDDAANQATSDADVSGADARVRTVVVTAAEDVEVGREVRRVLG
ncbi:MAG TPA: acetate/propionate family kinase [Nocardioides sp.]|nr:acetate/propionate family kinase [Nocardioides sp.]